MDSMALTSAEGQGSPLDPGFPEGNTSSLPSIKNTSASPYDENQRLRRELSVLRKRYRQLDFELKQELQRSQLDRIALAYGQSDPNGAFPATKKLPEVKQPVGPSQEDLREARETKSRLYAAERELEELQAEMDLMRSHYEEKMEALDGKRSLEREKMGHALEEAQAAAAKKEEQEKQKRIELLRRQIARRIMNQGYIRGWQAWHELWSAKAYALRRLRQVANRLQTPQGTQRTKQNADYRGRPAELLLVPRCHKETPRLYAPPPLSLFSPMRLSPPTPLRHSQWRRPITPGGTP